MPMAGVAAGRWVGDWCKWYDELTELVVLTRPWLCVGARVALVGESSLL